MVRNFEITSEMTKGFAAEMTEKMNNGMFKKGCAIANFIATAKCGKTTECCDGLVKVSTNVRINYPFNVCKPNNIRKGVIYDANNTVVGGSYTILYHVADALSHLMSVIDSIKTWRLEAGFSKTYFECYPDLRPAIEEYGFEWFEEKYNEFSEYLTKLGGVAEDMKENDTPMLDNEEQDEYDTLGTGAIEMFNSYMRERVSEEFENLVDTLKDSADEFSGEDVFAEFDYEFDYVQEWLDFITNMDDINVTSEYALAFYKENIEDFINVDDIQEYIYSIEEGCGARSDDHGLECCNVYVENPYYVSDKMRAYRIAKVVNDNWVKNAVEDYVKLDWSLFNEQDMELMFSDSDFAEMVYDRVCERNKYFSECLAYDDCFYVWLTENVGCVLVDYIYDLDSRPAWVDRNNFDFKDCGDHLEIIMFGSHKIGLYYDPSDSSADFACAENGAAYGKRDMEYAVEIMDNRDMILALAEKVRIVKPIAEEQEEFNKVA